MEFIEVDVAAAIGAIAAHSVRGDGFALKKGETVSAERAATLAANGVSRLTVARLAPGDREENELAHALALKAAGANIRVADPFTGRANLHARAAGVLQIDSARVDRFNGIDERITLATLPPFRVVAEGEMVGTVKIIPFAVDAAAAAAAAAQAGDLLSVAPFRPRKVAVISTLLPGLKAKTVAKTLKALETRLAVAGASIAGETRVVHETEAVAHELRAAAQTEAGLAIVYGASAVTDRRDVIPAAIEAAGGKLIHVGMPVDPGNLLVLGELGGRPVIGAPGCARSPRENGFDWVLQRLLADIPVNRADIMRMGVGGLLMEIGARGQPRDPGAQEE